VYSESVKSKSEAAKREYEIKQMTRAQKLSLIKPYA
jgi:predicted GIY-YIG superfamily endonuclease